MKVLKKISLEKATILQSNEMKNILGAGTGCEGKDENSCSGDCTVSGGYSGRCGWTRVWNRCTCGAVYVEL